MKYSIIGELLGVLFVTSLVYVFMNSRELELIVMLKMVVVLYVPQRIALYLQCKSLVDKKLRQMEKKENE